MSYGINNVGEAALLAYYFDNNSMVMGVYRDSTDALSDTETESDITTEPTGSLYGREGVEPSEVTTSIENGSGLSNLDPQTFNVSDSVQKIDAAFFYNSTDGFFVRYEVDTSSYPNDYIDLAELDNLRLGGNALKLE